MPVSAEMLLVNNNNARTKFALADPDGLVEGAFRVLDTSLVDGEAVSGLLADWGYRRVVMASVVPARAAVLREILEPSPIEVSHRVRLGVEVEFPEPETIGADRLANAAAVAGLLGGGPAIVVDFGTAVTFDIVATGPAYVGGVIAPGLDMMRDYLHDRTALLPRIDLREPPAAIGKSTVDAMLSGAVHGYRGMVREILARVVGELREREGGTGDPRVVATGGYAELIAAGLPEIEAVDPHFTLEGLRLIGNLNPEGA